MDFQEYEDIKRSMSSSDRNADKERRLNANMIERRRMQTINSGFTSLKRLLPPTEKKQTKAAILQQAVQHIMRLQRTVIQVRETNSVLRENLADERKQRLSCRKQLDAFISEKFARHESFQARGAFFTHAPQTKGQPLTPPHEDHSDRAFNRWSPTPYDGAGVICNDCQVFDLSSCRDSRKLDLAGLIRKRCEAWDVKGDPHGRRSNQLQRPSSEVCADETAPSYQKASGFSCHVTFRMQVHLVAWREGIICIALWMRLI
ncbi:Helix-loop-helix DNA-binding domain [Desmophyllum pertusum]|uniref:Helix-loop-helix DNA-binding domain n=1 Tax=Desmophyllum pertusum TaxID=174260 RepID=A0A9W9ZAR9_9CNID|nr:Helix-loop-helix DNA-binding domain [Desmophyllum pertusum]